MTVRAKHPRVRPVPAYGATPDVPDAAGDAIVAAALDVIVARHAATRRAATSLTPRDAENLCRLHLSAAQREVFAVMFLDNRHRVIAVDDLCAGTVDSASIYPREIVKAALRRNAVAVILAHNHPSGGAEPSAADRAITIRLSEALALIDVRVLDHFVVGADSATSFAARGYL